MGKYKRYAQTSIVLALIITLALAIGPTIRTLAAETIFKIQNAELTSISDGAEGAIASFDESNIISNVVFHHLNDSATYKITLKNSDSKDHIIETITDDNENSYISYNYNKHENELINSGNNLVFDLTAIYSTANTDPSARIQSTNVKFYIHFTDVEEPVEIDLDVPNTGANTIAKTTSEKNQDTLKTTLGIIIAASAGLIVIAIIAVKKHKKFAKITAAFVIAGSAFAIAANVKAVVAEINSFTITTEYGLYDKLIIHNGDEDVIISYGEKLEDVNEIVEPTKPGYTFEGWEDENGNDIDPNNPIVNDVMIRPKFTAITYTIKFNGNGAPADQQMPDQVLTYDQAQNLTTNTFAWDGHNFSGWDTTITGNGTYYADGQEVKNLTTTNNDVIMLYAQWSVNPYHIEYDANGGTGEMAVTNCEYDQDCILRQNAFTKYGYDFKGWTFNNNNYDDEATVRNLATSGTITMVAKWEAHEYQITYTGLTDAEAAALRTAGNPDFYTIETQSFQLHNPADRKDNDGDTTQMFLGWREITTITPVIILPMQDYLGDKTFEAVWQDKAFPRYDITYNLDGGEVATANPTTHDKTESFTLNNPTKAGYVFVGWTGTTIEGDTPVHDYTLPAPHARSAIEFTAHYNRNTYTVNFSGNENTGGSTASMTMTYDEAQNLTANGFTKTGYIFNGWKYNNTDYSDGEEVINLTTEPNGVVEMVAQWQPTQYTIIFHANNDNVENPDAMAAQVVTYDVETTLNPTEYTWWQHKLVEWTTNANGTGTKYADKATIKNLNANGGEVHLYAKWREIDAALDGRGNMTNKGINTKLKAITTANPDAKNFLHYPNGEPSDEIKASATDLSGTIDPIYAWVDGENIYWWSEDVKPRISTNNSVEYHYYGVGKSTAEGNVNNLEYMDLTGFDTTGIVGSRSPFEYTNIRRVDISDWDLSNATDMSYFAYHSNLEDIIFPEHFDIQKVTSLNMAFSGAKLKKLDFRGWKTRDLKFLTNFIQSMPTITEVTFGGDFKTDNVTSMASMINMNANLATINNINTLNTANVTSMRSMFDSDAAITSLDLSAFDTTALTDMAGMFKNMSGLTSLTLKGSFTAANVTNMESTFNGVKNINTFDLSNLVSKPTNLKQTFAFTGGGAIETIDISNMDLSDVTTVEWTFFNANSGLKTIYTSSSVNPEVATDNTATFQYDTGLVGGANTHAYDVGGISSGAGSRIDDPDNGNPGYFTYKNARYIRYHDNDGDDTNDEANYALMPSHYITTAVENPYNLATKLTKNNFTRSGFVFTGWATSADGNVVYADEVEITTEASKTPLELYAIWIKATSVLQTGSNVNAILKSINPNVVSFVRYNGIPDFDAIDDERVISLSNAVVPTYAWSDGDTIYWWSEAETVYLNEDSKNFFKNLSKLTTIEQTTLDTSKVKNMDYMFQYSGLVDFTFEMDTSNVTSMDAIFANCSKLERLDLSHVDTSKVTNMHGLVADAQKLTYLNLDNFSTASATNLESMFSTVKLMTTLDLTSFDTRKVTNMGWMISYITNLQTIYATDLFVPANNISMPNTLVGGAGSRNLGTSSVYARIDDPDNGTPGYFTIKGARYIRYHDNDGDDTNNEANSALMTSHYLTNTGSLKPNAFTNGSKTFTGWNTAADGSGDSYTDGQAMTELTESKTPLELYAQWSGTVGDSHTITYYSNNDSATGSVEPQTVNAGEDATVAANGFTLTHNHFRGWNTQADGEGTHYNPEDVITNPSDDIDLYAEWKTGCQSFATDPWSVVAADFNSDPDFFDPTETCEREIEMDVDGDNENETYRLRLINTSTPDACLTAGFSQTACGVVVEFVNTIGKSKWKASGEPRTGWYGSDLITYLNGTVYDKMPADLQNVIIPTYIVSGYSVRNSSGVITPNTSPDITLEDTDKNKIYLHSPKEIGVDFVLDNKREYTRINDFYQIEDNLTAERVLTGNTSTTRRFWSRSMADLSLVNNPPFNPDVWGWKAIYLLKNDSGVNEASYSVDTDSGSYDIIPVFRIGIPRYSYTNCVDGSTFETEIYLGNDYPCYDPDFIVTKDDTIARSAHPTNITIYDVPGGIIVEPYNDSISTGPLVPWVQGTIRVKAAENTRVLNYQALAGFRSAKTIMLPNALTTIGNESLRLIPQMEFLALPDSVQSIGDNALKDCSSLTAILYRGTIYTTTSALTSALAENGVTLGSNIFSGVPMPTE